MTVDNRKQYWYVPRNHIGFNIPTACTSPNLTWNKRKSIMARENEATQPRHFVTSKNSITLQLMKQWSLKFLWGNKITAKQTQLSSSLCLPTWLPSECFTSLVSIKCYLYLHPIQRPVKIQSFQEIYCQSGNSFLPFCPFIVVHLKQKKSVWKKEKQENVFLLYVVLLRNVLFSLYLAGQVVELAGSKSSFLGHTFILVLNHTKKGKEYDEEQ